MAKERGERRKERGEERIGIERAESSRRGEGRRNDVRDLYCTALHLLNARNKAEQNARSKIGRMTLRWLFSPTHAPLMKTAYSTSSRPVTSLSFLWNFLAFFTHSVFALTITT